MRYLDRIRRLERRFPPPRREVIVRWGSEIFSTKGWRISYDENGVFTKTGNVPPEYTEDMLQPPCPTVEADS
jgi:hypothetical protein